MSTGPNRLRTTCLITHHDYGAFVGDAIRSAVGQSPRFDEIVVVDDGSSPDSLAVVREECGRHASVTLIEQENRGQLAAFHAGLRVSQGDLVLFLDADDRYEPGHLARVLAWFEARPECDWVTSAWRTFGAENRVHRLRDEDTDLGFQVVLSLSGSLKKLGISPTSTLAIRRSVLERFLPLPFEHDWRIRADDCLVFGAALSGARKGYLAEPLVRYRVHGDNAWHGRPTSADADFRRAIALRRLIPWLSERLGYGAPPVELAPRELRSLARPRWSDLRAYAKIVLRSDLPFSRQAALLTSLVHGFGEAALAPADGRPPLRQDAGQRRLRTAVALLALLTLWVLVLGGGQLDIGTLHLSITGADRPFLITAALALVAAWREPRFRPELERVVRFVRAGLRPGRRLGLAGRVLVAAAAFVALLALLGTPSEVARVRARGQPAGWVRLQDNGDQPHLRELVKLIVTREEAGVTIVHVRENDARAHLAAYYAYPRLLEMAPEVRRWSLRERMAHEDSTDPAFDAVPEQPPVELSRAFALAGGTATVRGRTLVVVPDDLVPLETGATASDVKGGHPNGQEGS